VQPRVFRGYITRDFIDNNHPGWGPQRAYELDMPAPRGLSGAPLIVHSIGPVGLRLVGVVYGSTSIDTMADDGTVVSFGLAHHWDVLRALSGPATSDRPLHELLPTAPSF
jgi:hypothetical protein